MNMNEIMIDSITKSLNVQVSKLKRGVANTSNAPLRTRDSADRYIYCTQSHGCGFQSETLRALAVVRFGHRPPVRCHKLTDRTDYNTLRRS